jgi:hypothetical protein
MKNELNETDEPTYEPSYGDGFAAGDNNTFVTLEEGIAYSRAKREYVELWTEGRLCWRVFPSGHSQQN